MTKRSDAGTIPIIAMFGGSASSARILEFRNQGIAAVKHGYSCYSYCSKLIYYKYRLKSEIFDLAVCQ